ncbi:MAG: sulfatase-like hydrolase/transferase [Halioglobus sp.]
MLAASAGTPHAGAESKHPTNLLLILTDQQRWDSLSIAGNEHIETPNLDRLAREGAFFTHAYTQMAVCAPARASILTGHTVENTGITSNRQTYNAATSEGLMQMPTLDEILVNQHDYVAEYHGKWHALTSRAEIYSNPQRIIRNNRSVFGRQGQSLQYRDYLRTHFPPRAPGASELMDPFSKRPYLPSPIDKHYGAKQEDVPKGAARPQPDLHGTSIIPAEHSITAFQAQQAIAALERRKDQPFSITVSFHFPHAPLLPPREYWERFPVHAMPVPASIGDDLEHSPYRRAAMKDRGSEYQDPEKLRYMTAAYYALVTELDDWIGTILHTLDTLGLAENTLVVFTSDHGEMLGAHGMREKNVFYEESARVPLIMRLPGKIQPNTRVDGYVSNMDIFSTVVDYLELGSYPSDGQSLRGLITGDDRQHGEFVVTEWACCAKSVPNYMVVADGWKLMVPYLENSKILNGLYDLNNDPHELLNLLGSDTPDKAHLQKAEHLRTTLLQWLQKTGSKHYDGVKARNFTSSDDTESSPGPDTTHAKAR